MIRFDIPAIAVAAIAAFILAAAYYVAVARQRAQLSPAAAATSQPRPSVMALELGKALVVASVVAALGSLIGISSVPGALALALALWVAFPLVLLLGSVVHERVPVGLAAIHAGDWLVKLIAISLIVSLWP
jgi:phosphatidylglycerophosphate synthase